MSVKIVPDDVWIEIFSKYSTMQDVMKSVRLCNKFFHNLTLQDLYYKTFLASIVEKLIPMIEKLNKMKLFDYENCPYNKKSKFKKKFESDYMFDYYHLNIDMDLIKNHCSHHEIYQIYYELKEIIGKHGDHSYNAMRNFALSRYDYNRQKFPSIDIEKENTKVLDGLDDIIHIYLPTALQICRYDSFYLFKLFLKLLQQLNNKHNKTNDNFAYNAGKTLPWNVDDKHHKRSIFEMTPLFWAIKHNAKRIGNYILSFHNNKNSMDMCKDIDNNNDNTNNNKNTYLNNNNVIAMLNTTTEIFKGKYTLLPTIVNSCRKNVGFGMIKVTKRIREIMLIENLMDKDENKQFTKFLHEAIENICPNMVEMLIEFGADVYALDQDRMGPLYKLVNTIKNCDEKDVKDNISLFLKITEILVKNIDFKKYPKQEDDVLFRIIEMDHVFLPADDNNKIVALVSKMFKEILNKMIDDHGVSAAIEIYFFQNNLILSKVVMNNLKDILGYIGQHIRKYRKIIENNEMKQYELYKFVNGIGKHGHNFSPYVKYCQICNLYKNIQEIFEILINDICVDILVKCNTKDSTNGSDYIDDEKSPQLAPLKSRLKKLEDKARKNHDSCK